jgi:hypothetical protein
MVLSIQQSQELLKNPANKAAVLEALQHEERIKLHTKAVDKRSKASAYFKTFLKWVKDEIKLPADKFAAFEGMCLFPLPTTSFCGSIFDEYKKVFTSQDAYRDYSLLDDSFKTEFKLYIEEEINVKGYFQDKGLEDLKENQNCVYVVDLPSSQSTPRPQPYFYKIPISAVVDLGVTRTLNNHYKISYLAFQRGKLFTVIDDEKYMVFEKGRKGDVINAEDNFDYSLITIAFHNLGFVPACFLSLANLYSEEDGNLIAKKNPLSPTAGDLDWLLFFKIARRCFQTYGPFPIMTIPSSKCNFEDAEGMKCSSGMVPYRTQREGLSCYPCPACNKSSVVGPGTIFKRSVPQFQGDPKLDPAAVEITAVPVDSLAQIDKIVDDLEWDMYENAVGASDQEPTKEAINEKQVEKSVQGKKNVLLDLKKHFEHAERFIIDTMGKFMYGDYYMGCTINYGEQFLLYSASDVVDQFIGYKKAGLPLYLVAEKKELLIQTEYKNNPYAKQRADLMNLLEPWPDLSPNECMGFQLNRIFPEKFGLKIDFAKFISKFELANGDIVQWGTLLTLEQKIIRLNLILTDYVRQEYKTADFEVYKPQPGAGPTSKS